MAESITPLGRIVAYFNANFSKNPDLQGILADYIEEHDDKRADLVRQGKSFIDKSIRAYKTPVKSPFLDPVNWILEYNTSLLRRYIISLFPECYPPREIEIGTLLTDIQGIGVCCLDEGEEVYAAAIKSPNENGEFEAIGSNTPPNPNNPTSRIHYCKIGESMWRKWEDTTKNGNRHIYYMVGIDLEGR